MTMANMATTTSNTKSLLLSPRKRSPRRSPRKSSPRRRRRTRRRRRMTSPRSKRRRRSLTQRTLLKVTSPIPARSLRAPTSSLASRRVCQMLTPSTLTTPLIRARRARAPTRLPSSRARSTPSDPRTRRKRSEARSGRTLASREKNPIGRGFGIFLIDLVAAATIPARHVVICIVICIGQIYLQSSHTLAVSCIAIATHRSIMSPIWSSLSGLPRPVLTVPQRLQIRGRRCLSSRIYHLVLYGGYIEYVPCLVRA